MKSLTWHPGWIRNWRLYLFVLPALLYFLIFQYWPMYGVQIAFRNFNPALGITGSPWVGLANLYRFFNSYYFWALIRNTMFIALYQLSLFPLAIIIALSMNEVRRLRFKKFVQTITYAPHFISVVVMAGMILAFLSPETGVINKAVIALGYKPIAFLNEPGWFKTVYVFSGEWQNLGWSAIIYLAALAGINPALHEAATMDGANRFQRIWHINIPGILPTIIILFILNMGQFMNIGFEKIYLLQNPLNLGASDVIQTFVYRSGLLQGNYSYAAAVGLFNSVINFILLFSVNVVARRVNETSLW